VKNGQAAKKFEDLAVWQKAHALVLRVYTMTRGFPKEELFGLAAQMRRAAVSVPANIVEGFYRTGWSDKARFMNVAQSSLEELRYYFILSRDLGYLKPVSTRRISMRLGECSAHISELFVPSPTPSS
jgi:four helix bundle protein